MSKVNVMTCLVCCAILSGCGAPRGLNHTVTPAEDIYSGVRVSASDAEFGEKIANLALGASLTVSLKGTTTELTVVDSYFSALGEECKMLRVRSESEMRKNAAVCRNPSGQWRYLSPLN